MVDDSVAAVDRIDVLDHGFVRLDAQVARFRRGDSTRVVAAYDVSADTIFGRKKFAAALVAMGDEATTPSAIRVEESPARNADCPASAARRRCDECC